MKSAVWQNLDLAARKLTPFLLSLVLVILNLVPLHLPGYAAISPNFALMAIYYWALHRPSLLPSGAVFIIGLLQDFMSGGPIGQNAAILVVVYIIAVSQARFFYGKSFFVVWWGFMVVSLCVATMEWVIASLMEASMLAPEPAFYECAMNVAAYPIFGWLFVQVHRTLPQEE
jgi:rod shape-determining protein MreD